MNWMAARAKAAALIKIVNGACTADVPALHALVESMTHVLCSFENLVAVPGNLIGSPQAALRGV